MADAPVVEADDRVVVDRVAAVVAPVVVGRVAAVVAPVAAGVVVVAGAAVEIAAVARAALRLPKSRLTQKNRESRFRE